MKTSRLEAFSDGVLAIIITIMVLELHPPHEPTLASLKPLFSVLLSYILSFVYVGIYWNNHHHMFQITQRVTGGILWANLHLLFWLSLIPAVTAWTGATNFATVPVAFYGTVLLLAAVAYYIVQHTILRTPDAAPSLKTVLGRDIKGKLSPLLYAIAIPLSFANRWLAMAIYAVVALMWLIPDPRIEKKVEQIEESGRRE